MIAKLVAFWSSLSPEIQKILIGVGVLLAVLFVLSIFFRLAKVALGILILLVCATTVVSVFFEGDDKKAVHSVTQYFDDDTERKVNNWYDDYSDILKEIKGVEAE